MHTNNVSSSAMWKVLLMCLGCLLLEVSSSSEDCSRLHFIPDPKADVLLHATLVSQTNNELTVRVQDIIWGDLSVSPSACWLVEGLHIVVRTDCGDSLESGNDYLFSLKISRSTCPTVVYGGTYAPILLTLRRQIRDVQSNATAGKLTKYGISCALVGGE